MFSNFKPATPDTFSITILVLSLDFVISNDTISDDEIPKEQLDPDHENFNFKEYLNKFSPSKVWEEIDKKRKYEGIQISDQEQLDIMFNALDQTDNIYNLRVGTKIPETEFPKDGRRFINWTPPRGLSGFWFDPHYTRNRIYDLMRQAIYQARNRMIVMQINRERYRKSALYKMGFLTNKADITVKTFCKVSFRSLRTCVASRTATMLRAPHSELLEYNRRQLTLWLDAQILGQLIERNHEIAINILLNESLPNKQTFNKMFIP